MADITKCDAGPNQSCPFKYKCYRFTAPVSPYRQAWFTQAPYDQTSHSCLEYWATSKVAADQETAHE